MQPTAQAVGKTNDENHKAPKGRKQTPRPDTPCRRTAEGGCPHMSIAAACEKQVPPLRFAQGRNDKS